jgi:hypothetical protein
MPRIDKDDLKRRLPLPQLMAVLGHGDRAKREAFCPFHENKKTEAFSVWQNETGWHWKCHTGCGGGDEISYLQQLFNEPYKSALRRLADLAGGLPADGAPRISKRQQSVSITARKEVKWPNDMHAGSDTDLRAVANLRAVSFDALQMMRALGLLKFGKVCGVPAWIVLDHSSKCGEARRMDGLPFDEIKTSKVSLPQRKAHTLGGSVKSWPVGLSMPEELTKNTSKFMLVEGGPDLLAAYHLKLEMNDAAWTPIALLGAGVNRIDPEALALLRGRRVKIIEHADAAGETAAPRWAKDLSAAGARVSGFKLQGLGLSKPDGAPAGDLNDCTGNEANLPILGGLFK